MEEQRANLVHCGNLDIAIVDERLHERDSRDVPRRGENQWIAARVDEHRLRRATGALSAQTQFATSQFETKREFAVANLRQVRLPQSFHDVQSERLARRFP